MPEGLKGLGFEGPDVEVAVGEEDVVVDEEGTRGERSIFGVKSFFGGQPAAMMKRRAKMGMRKALRWVRRSRMGWGLL